MHRLVVVGDVGGGEREYHVGDEAMLEANLATLARLLPGVQATVVSPRPWNGPGAVANLRGLGFPRAGAATETQRRQLVDRFLAAALGGGAAEHGELVEALRQADCLLVSGGGNLCSRWPEHLYERVALARLAGRLGKPVAFVGQTVGPELTAAERELLAPALNEAAWVGVRELPSVSLALALGVAPERLDYQLDDAFMLDPRPPSAGERRQLPSLDGEWIAVTLHPLAAAGSDAVRAIADQLAALSAATGARLLFLPHQENGDEHSDASFSRAVAAMLPPALAAWVGPVLPAALVRWLTGEAAMVVSSRYHPLVFGLSAGVPGLAIHADEYCRVKAQGALTHAGQSAWWNLAREAAVGGELASRALELWKRRGPLRSELLRLQPSWRDQEARRWGRLLAALGLAETSTAPATGELLGVPTRLLALQLAAALQERDAAARAEAERLRGEVARMGQEVERLHAELRWVTGTAAWRLRQHLLRLRTLVTRLPALSRLRRPRRGDRDDQPAAVATSR